VLAALAGGSLASAGAAQAGDLVVLAPDSVTLSGPLSYDHVYVGDGATVRLAGDTSLAAADVYIAGGAILRTCYVPPSNDNGCTSGRFLQITSSGQINIGSGINLSAQAGTNRPGGSLVLQANGSIAVSNGIDTSGSMGGGSGSVSITSGSTIALSSPYYQSTVNAPGAGVAIHGTSVSLSNGINTAGSDAAIISGAPVNVGGTSSVVIHGNVTSNGRDASGGNGASVTLYGTSVNVGRVDASAGTSSTGAPGIAGAVTINGTTAVTISDYIDTRGSSGATGYPSTPGANIRITSGGPVLTGALNASGANADSSTPSGSGTVFVSGAAVATGQVFTVGGSRSGTAGPGASGNNVALTATGALTIGDVEAYGGNGFGDNSPGGNGGRLDVVGDGVITSELRTNAGNSGGASPGASGGPILVTGKSSASILGGVYSYGANASGAAYPGGSGNVVALHASAGPLSLAAPINSSGGNGANASAGIKAGAGGPGGTIDLVGTPIDPIAGISSEGGNGGYSSTNDLRGYGGAGGSLHAWSETNVFGGLRSISTAGGSGAPPGPDGAQLLDSGPSGLAVDPTTGLLSFTSHSPYADGFNIIRSVAGAPPTLVLTTKSTSKLAVPPTDVCVSIAYQVSAFETAVGWTSPASPAVTFLRQPSASQKCTDAPSLAHASKAVLLKAANLTKKKGVFSFVVQANGAGTISASASTKGAKKPVATGVATAKQAGSVRVTLTLVPKTKLVYKTVKKRQVARIAVKLMAAAPTGAAKTSITVSVEVRK
jgi:hypothetical protein